jgi:multidrug efflux pump subunit AcrA (membrane-fusion protein)
MLPIIILLTGAGAFAALKATRPEPKPLEPREKTWAIVTQRIESETLSPNLRLFGRTESPRTAHLSAGIAADVVDVSVLEGERVTAGKELVRLDDRDARLMLNQYEAEISEVSAQIELERKKHANDLKALAHERELLALTRREVERARKLANTNVGSLAQLDASQQAVKRQMLAVDTRQLAIWQHASVLAQLESKIRRAESFRDRARLDLQRTRVVAPFDGRTTTVFVTTGDRVKSGDPLVSLYDTSALEIRAQVPTRYLPKVRQSLVESSPLTARTRIDGFDVSAILDRITGEVRAGSGGADALFRIRDGSPWLPLSRTVELIVELPAVEDAVALPPEAIYGTDRVYVLDGDRMKSVQVERFGEMYGPGGENRVLVRGPGLEPGRQVIITQLPNAIDGLRVRVVDG